MTMCTQKLDIEMTLICLMSKEYMHLLFFIKGQHSILQMKYFISQILKQTLEITNTRPKKKLKNGTYQEVSGGAVMLVSFAAFYFTRLQLLPPLQARAFEGRNKDKCLILIFLI